MRRFLCALSAALLLWTASACAAGLPAGLLVIEAEAFAGVPLVELTLPDGLQAIGAHAFSTASLRHVTIPASVTQIDPTAFDGTAQAFFATVIKGSFAESWCRQVQVPFSYTAAPYIAPTVSALSFSQQGDKYLGRSYSEMDCQAFVEACARDVGINLNLAGSNAWYRTMDWTGSPEACKALFGSIPKGAFLFIHAYDGGEPSYYHDDLGNASHMGIYTGTRRGAIHSSRSRGGVFDSYFDGKTINGGWNCVGLWMRMDYGEDINRWLQSLAQPESTFGPELAME